ncbi:MAG: hypothetical protein WB510_19750, partial [Candidatus Sulfotelmatobacter sp.]
NCTTTEPHISFLVFVILSEAKDLWARWQRRGGSELHRSTRPANTVCTVLIPEGIGSSVGKHPKN